MTSFGLTRAPQQILFGLGQRHNAGTMASQLGSKALICTDKRLTDSLVISEIQEALAKAGTRSIVFDGTLPDVPQQNILECVDKARTFTPDVVVAVGGGSCIDLAKCSSLLLSHGGVLSTYYGEFKVPGPTVPIVAIPTTAGTGSEVTPVAVITDADRELKVGISSPYLIPKIAICDPELTYACPGSLTASAGADALTHAIEAFTAVERAVDTEIASARVFVGKNVMSDHFALKAIKCISRSLFAAVNDGAATEHRDQLMLGSLLAGLAFGTAGTAAAHAIQYPVGAATHTPHGIGVAVLMPYVMRFNKPMRLQQFREIAEALGVLDTERTDEEIADNAISAVEALFASIGIPRTLADLGLPETRLQWTAEQALSAKRLIDNNPRLIDLSASMRIVEAAYTGNRQLL